MQNINAVSCARYLCVYAQQFVHIYPYLHTESTFSLLGNQVEFENDLASSNKPMTWFPSDRVLLCCFELTIDTRYLF